MRWLEVALAAVLCSLASSNNECPQGCSCMDGAEVEVDCNGTSLRGIKGYYVNVNCQSGKNISCALISWYSPRLLSLSACPPIPHCAGVEELTLKYPLEVEDQLKEVGGDIKTFTVRGERDAVQVPPSLFALPSLTSLCMNRVSPHLPVLPASPSSPLRTLELSDAGLSALPEGFLAALPDLRALRLWRNQFTEIPDQVFNAPALVNLSMSSNKLSSARCPPAAGQLRSLSLFDNPLTEVGPFSGCAHLVKIDIFDTRHNTTISEFAFANLTELTSLTLRNCNLKFLPGNMFLNATSLQELFLNRNKLVQLPKGLLKDTKSLRKLDLSSNLLEVLDDDVFAEMNRLEELFLDNNKLKVLPDNLIQSSSSTLLVFSASHNLLTTLSSRLLRHCNKLKLLNLQYNMLREEEVPGYHNLEVMSPFNSLTSVERVMLSHNQYSTLYRDFGTILLRMVSLQLDHNYIQDLDDYSELAFLQDHITVNLTHNLIHTIQLTPVPRFHRDSQISSNVLIQDNPFHCDCSLYVLLASSKGLMSTRPTLPKVILGNAMCETPKKNKGVFLKDLKLEELTCDLPAEDCVDKCDCIARPHNMSLEITCPVIPDNFPDSGGYSVDLRINKTVNLVKNLSPNVRTLHLSGLAMKEVPIGNYSYVKHLDLRDNNLEYIPSELFSNNISLLLSGNPISCQCGDAEKVEELQRNSNKIKDYLLVSCGEGKGAISAQDPDGLCSAEKAVIAGVLFAAFGVIVAVIAVLLIRFRHYVKVILFAKGWCLCLVNEEELDKDRQYDAFISYCNNDKEFVLTKLLPGLESGPKPFKICVHERDWIAGEWIPAQIVRSVEQSRRTIIVLTNNFLHSLWSRLEFRAAMLSSQNENRSRVIVIVLEDISLNQEMDAELKAYLATNTYLKWGDPFFWERLRYALPHRKEEKIIRHDGKQLMQKVLQPQGGLHTELTPEGLIINAANKNGKDVNVKSPAAILPAKCHDVKDVKTPAIMAANCQNTTVCVNDKQKY